MLEKPDLPDQRIIDALWEAYRLQIAQVEFLPIGDISSAKYRVVAHEPAAFWIRTSVSHREGHKGRPAYFLKLRKNNFEETSVFVPQFLYEQGISQVIPALKTLDGRLWTGLEAYTCIVYPFIEGLNGFENRLSAGQWREFGAALQDIHSLLLPPELRRRIPSETYAPHWRERVRETLLQAEPDSFADPVAAKMAAVLQAHRDEILRIVRRAEQLGDALRANPPERVLCHSDIHAGNLLLEPNGAVHLIDWDSPILAPKERDLMFIGGGVGGIWNTPQEEGLFYQGYGAKGIDLAALTYYRYERILEDIAEFSRQILWSTQGGADRERSLRKFSSIFYPNQVLEIAYQTDRTLNEG